MKRSEIGILSSKFRRGTITPEEMARLEVLEAEECERSRQQAAMQRSPRTVMDLPIARRMWSADARDVERA